MSHNCSTSTQKSSLNAGTTRSGEGVNTVALRESAALLRAVAENTSVGLVIVDRNHRYKFANDVYLRILGCTDSIIGKTPAECLPANYEDRTGPRINRALAGEKFAFEAAIPTQSGPERLNYYSAVYEPEYDAHGAIIGVVVVVIDITEQKDREAHIRHLMDELNHRSKNLLSVVSAIAKQTSATRQSEFLQTFTARLKALAVSQDLLVKSGWKNIDAFELLRSQLAHLEDLVDRRIMLCGPPVSLNGSAAEAVGMVVHELSTNAMKYGALSGQTGSVKISWGISGRDIGDNFFISWEERNGPPVKPPSRSGFGRTVVTQLIEMNLGGSSELKYPISGLVWKFHCPASRVLAFMDEF